MVNFYFISKPKMRYGRKNLTIDPTENKVNAHFEAAPGRRRCIRRRYWIVSIPDEEFFVFDEKKIDKFQRNLFWGQEQEQEDVKVLEPPLIGVSPSFIWLDDTPDADGWIKRRPMTPNLTK